MHPYVRRGGAIIAAWTVLLAGTVGASLGWSGGAATASTVADASNAVWAPFTGTVTVACTRGNPGPWGVCDDHHSYIGAIDFPMDVGRPVLAAGAGQVVYVNATCAVGDLACEGGGGRWVGVQHPDGRVSRYMHLDTVAVRLGDRVVRGQKLGTAGLTGNATLPHLHYDEQRPLWTRTEMGDMFACHGSSFVRYPQALGYATWEEVPYGTVLRNDGDDCAGDLFYDVSPSSPFGDEIAWMAAEGLTDGYADGTFRPQDPVARQAMAAWLHRLAGAPGGPFPDPGFPDVSAGHPFATAIRWMVATGRAAGFADGTFRPTACVTRQAAAAFLHREAGAPRGPFPDPGFTDVSAGHPFATEIWWMADAGITTGYRDGSFLPDACVSRQAAAAFLYRRPG